MKSNSIKLLLFSSMISLAHFGCVKEGNNGTTVAAAAKNVEGMPASSRDEDCIQCDEWQNVHVTFLELPETEETYVVGGAIVPHCDEAPFSESCVHFIEHFNLDGHPNPTTDFMPFYSGNQPKDLIIVFGGWPSCIDEDWTVKLKVVFPTPVPITRYITCRKPPGVVTGYARINAPNCNGVIFPFACDGSYPTSISTEE